MRPVKTACMVGFMLSACATTTTENATSTTAAEASVPVDRSAGLTPERMEAIERVFIRRVPELNRCWVEEAERIHNNKMQGDLKVSFVVDEKGRVREAQILHSTLDNKSMHSCVTGKLSSWVFPEGPGEIPVVRTVHLGPDA